jgi:hypothetical protein
MIDGAVNRIAAPAAASLLLAACASAPKVTEATKRVASNPRAIVEGVVRDETGREVAGIGVRGVPRGKDIPWAPPVTTDCAGRFRLLLPAPGGYAFQLYWNGRSVATDDPADPLLVDLVLRPGEERKGLELTLLRGRWEFVTGESPGGSAGCGAGGARGVSR